MTDPLQTDPESENKQAPENQESSAIQKATNSENAPASARKKGHHRWRLMRAGILGGICGVGFAFAFARQQPGVATLLSAFCIGAIIGMMAGIRAAVKRSD
ncbi:MAG: hypothetical protein QNI92_03515 [Desulfobacterales bacterium]|nr:hypothetical protein [Desulfobacterales bacterium]MDJ0912791.1 hypothetical protein [Desulfobacterales bacterium]